MNNINRSVAVIKAKQPFVQWAKSLPDPLENLTLQQLHRDSHAYLFPHWDTPEEREELLADVYGFLFHQELFGWHRDERAFPRKRTLKMFHEWFDVEFHSVVVDLVDGDVVEEDY